MSRLSRGFRHLNVIICLVLVGASQAGCARRLGADSPIPLNAVPPFGSQSAILLPAGDYHLVTVRRSFSDRTSYARSQARIGRRHWEPPYQLPQAAVHLVDPPPRSEAAEARKRSRRCLAALPV